MKDRKEQPPVTPLFQSICPVRLHAPRQVFSADGQLDPLHLVELSSCQADFRFSPFWLEPSQLLFAFQLEVCRTFRLSADLN